MSRHALFRFALVFCSAVLCLGFRDAAARGAEIASLGRIEGVSFVSVAGRIVAGDSVRFNEATEGLPGRIAIVLESPGGALHDGLEIGKAIRSKGYATLIASRSTCMSACGLIWLAGEPRMIGQSGRVGFHAAYTKNGDLKQESGYANAMVGAYLAVNLHLSDDSIAFVTSSSPDQMNWLHADDAERLGIVVKVLPDPPSRAPRSASTAP